MADVIDAHHHLWNYDAAQYAWIGAGMDVLRRNFTFADFQRVAASAGISGSVVVQARQTLEETFWLLEFATQHPRLLGVVGWIPLRASTAAAHIADLRQHPKLKGLRHVVQDEPEDDFLLDTSFNRGISALADSGLVYDLLVRVSQLPATRTFVAQHPSQTFVLDHLAKPDIRSGRIDQWRTEIYRLAESPNVSCKLSGLVTEAAWDSWTYEDIAPILDTALDAFGSDRLMAGSDWPVCLLASTYQRWWDVLKTWTSQLRASERDRILQGTATAVYRLNLTS
jgi:L-fuconolactonase